MESNSSPLLPGRGAGAVDHRGLPVLRAASGGWTSALFIIAVEIAERFAFYGVSNNLITYLTGPLGMPTADAAANVNAWDGASSLLPLLGAFVADSWLGRYRTILCASALYILGLGMLSLSAELPLLLHTRSCSEGATTPCPPTKFQVALFFFSIYLISLAQGGHKPCVQAFGADQFDEDDPGERASKSSFFNWWYFGMCGGTMFTTVALYYVQDNISWALGFEIPLVSMAAALSIFLLGSRTYRYYETRIVQQPGRTIPHADSVVIDGNGGGGVYRAVLKLFPVWATCLIFSIVYSQASTFFVKQGSIMDRRIGTGTFLVPPAALRIFESAGTIAFIPIYDRVLVPAARRLTGVATGVTMLWRIGAGMVLSLGSMVVAAVVEMRRLRVARDCGLVDSPGVPVPMSLWWLVPQYVLFGVTDVFIMVGLQEFFYDQVPGGLRSLGLSLYLSIFGIGSFISSFLVSVIDWYSRKGGGYSWFGNNLNRGHLDYFYWLLAGLSAVQLGIFLCISRSYQYKKKSGVY